MKVICLYLRKLIIVAASLFFAKSLVPTIEFGPDPKNILLVIAGPNRLICLRAEQLGKHPYGLATRKTGTPNHEANL